MEEEEEPRDERLLWLEKKKLELFFCQSGSISKKTLSRDFFFEK
jgi:hypothetical protein